jgi:bifunctional UDP-N-acetylglucosamine pyrophosphorylase/glucosamine-1-phosphate N-acetyltransferase
MLTRVLDGLAAAGFGRPTVVVGYRQDLIAAVVGDRCIFIDQGEQLGTGHAARVGLCSLPPSVRRLVVVHGDEPMIGPEIYREMLDLQEQTGAPIVLLTAVVQDTRSLGRVIRDGAGHPMALLQESDLTPEQQALREVNLGAYVFDADFMREHMETLQPHAPKGEYYLTDLIAVAAAAGHAPVAAVTIPEGDELMGVNDLVQLERAGKVIYRRTARRLMASGVTIADSATTFIDDEVEIEPDTVIHPFTVISGCSRIGTGCQVGPGAHIVDSSIGDRCTVRFSTLEGAEVGEGVRIGPYAHLRPGARIGEGAEIGNYAEIKASTIGPGTRMHHMSYVGDAQVGRDVNIGAGTVTCNFDGRRKHRTVIEDGAFIGSDTMLRAPVTVGKGASTGAGSVVTRDVPPGVTVTGVPARPRAREAEAIDQETYEAESQSRRESPWEN